MEKLVGRTPPPARKGLRDWYDAYTHHGTLSRNGDIYKAAKKSLYEACLRAKDKCWEMEWFMRVYVPDQEFNDDIRHWINNDNLTGAGYYLVVWYDRQRFRATGTKLLTQVEYLKTAADLGYGPACRDCSWGPGMYMRHLTEEQRNAYDIKAWEWGDRSAIYEVSFSAIHALSKTTVVNVDATYRTYRWWMNDCMRVASELGDFGAATALYHQTTRSDDVPLVECARLAVNHLRNGAHDIMRTTGLSHYDETKVICEPVFLLYNTSVGIKGPSEPYLIKSLFIYGEYFANCEPVRLVSLTGDGVTVRRAIGLTVQVYDCCNERAEEAVVTWLLIARKTIHSLNKDMRGYIAKMIWKGRSEWPLTLQDDEGGLGHAPIVKPVEICGSENNKKRRI